MNNKPSHHAERGFRNIDPGQQPPSFTDFVRWVMGKHPESPREKDIRYSVEVDIERPQKLHAALGESFTVTWLGHSSLLVRIAGLTLLIDPIWSWRPSPVSWIGPKRHTAPPILRDDLPPIDCILITHNHYDHLDIPTLRSFGNAPRYFVPLGVGKTLAKHGITNYRELDWWEFDVVKGVQITCLPAQHFSSRTPFDRNRTLWCGWAVTSDGKRFYDAGDTGYFAGFREIGERMGPFDVAAIPIGAYLPKWLMGPVHIGPEDAIRAAEDLGARVMIPIHWGAFTLAGDPYNYAAAVLERTNGKRTASVPRVDILKIGETRIIHHHEAVPVSWPKR